MPEGCAIGAEVDGRAAGFGVLGAAGFEGVACVEGATGGVLDAGAVEEDVLVAPTWPGVVTWSSGPVCFAD